MMNTELLPRFSDTDALGHINNTKISAWFEYARRDLFKLFVPDLDVHNWNLIIVSLQIDFLGQIYYNDAVNIETGITKIGNSSFTVYQQIIQNGQVCAKGSTSMVHYDYKQKKAIPIPTPIRDELNKHFVQE